MRYLPVGLAVLLSGCWVPRVGAARLSDGTWYVSVSGRGEPSALVALWDDAAVEACGGPYRGEPAVESRPGTALYSSVGPIVVATPGRERRTVAGRVACLGRQ